MTGAIENSIADKKYQLELLLRREKSLMVSLQSRIQIVAALAATGLCVMSASGAGSFSNSLTAFTGNSSQPATIAALTAAGFQVSDTVTPEAVINFGANGPTFGVGQIVNDGRNYLRTVDSDYGNRSFVAEITMVAPDIDANNGYFGLGAGEVSPLDTGFRTPDWTTPFSSVMYWGENSIDTPELRTFLNDNGRGPFVAIAAPGQGNGNHRIRLTHDWFAKTMTIALDLNFAGGAFVADLTAAPIDTLPLYGGDGWPNEPARVFFGGDQDVAFRDFSVNVSSPNLRMGDFDSSGTVAAADWAILRDNQYANLSGKTLEQAFFLGDLTRDGKNDHDDFVAFKILYDEVNGVGAFSRMVAGVPEPSALALAAGAMLAALALRRPGPNAG